MPSHKPVKPTTIMETSVLLDEIKSLADVVRSIKEELFWLKFGATRSDFEPIKTELRLIRSDLAALEKRLTAAEPEAKLDT